MKRFACLNLQTTSLCIAGADIILALATLSFCTFNLYEDLVDISQWPQQTQSEDVQLLAPFSTFLSTMVDYVLVHEFSQAFYMILLTTIWIKALINLVVAMILVDGIKKQRLICIAPWIINTSVSMMIEIATFICLEIKIDDIDASIDRRIARAIVFGVFLLLNALFNFAIYAIYRVYKTTANENRALQESIVETAGMFQHIKV